MMVLDCLVSTNCHLSKLNAKEGINTGHDYGKGGQATTKARRSKISLIVHFLILINLWRQIVTAT
jgi:hypothetical protein